MQCKINSPYPSNWPFNIRYAVPFSNIFIVYIYDYAVKGVVDRKFTVLL
jgi:hypothetical protein